MRMFVLIFLVFVSCGFAVKARPMFEPKHPVIAELGWSIGSVAVAGATSWGGYLLFDWGARALTPETWDKAITIVGKSGLYGLGYGVLIPIAASTGVISVGILAGERRPSWGAVVGGYLGSAASVPFAIWALKEPSLGKAGLAAGSVIVLPSIFSWLGYRLTPGERKDEAFLPSRIKPYFFCNNEKICTGIALIF